MRTHRKTGCTWAETQKPPPMGTSGPRRKGGSLPAEVPAGQEWLWGLGWASPRCAVGEALGRLGVPLGWIGGHCSSVSLPTGRLLRVVGTAPPSGTPRTLGRLPCGRGRRGPEDPPPALHVHGACRSQSPRSSVGLRETLASYPGFAFLPVAFVFYDKRLIGRKTALCWRLLTALPKTGVMQASESQRVAGVTRWLSSAGVVC